MAHPTLEYIRGLRKSLETKKAEIVGEPPSSIPGAEHDSKPSPEATQPDPEVKDQTMVPNSGLTTEGAKDDSAITHTNDLIAGEPALTPEKKPEVSGDADAKTAEALAAEILTGIDSWYAAQKQASSTPPSAGEGTAEALITDTGKEPEQTKDVITPTGKDEITADAMVPATGEGSSGETAAAAKEAGALDMELTSDVLAKIAAVMLATEEGTQLAESLLAKAAGAEAAEKTLNFLRDQNDIAQKQAEYEAGQRDAIELILKAAQEAELEDAAAGSAVADAGIDDGGITEIADTLDAMIESGEITEDEADQVVVEIAQALADEGGAEGTGGAEGAADTAAPAGDVPAKEQKEAQAVVPAAGTPATEAVPAELAGNAAINSTVAPDPSQLAPVEGAVGADDITADDVADAIDSLVESGEITEDEADQLVLDITGDAEGADAAMGEEVSPEEIATALQEAVDSGEISPEDVQQVLTELESVPADAAAADTAAVDAAAAGADASAAADAAAADAAAASAAAPAAGAADAVAPVDEPKTAAAELIRTIRAARKAARQ